MTETQTTSEHGSSATGCAGSLSECAHNAPQGKAPRTFYRRDYGRMSKVLRRMRHVQGDPFTPKPEAQQDEVSALVLTIAKAFEADSDRFDPAEFVDSTALPEDAGTESYPSAQYDGERYAVDDSEDAG